MLTGKVVVVAGEETGTNSFADGLIIEGPQGERITIFLKPYYPPDIYSQDDLIQYIHETLEPLALKGWDVKVSINE